MQAIVGIVTKMGLSLLSERLIKTIALIALKKVLEASEKDEDSELSETNKRIYDEVAKAWGME